MAKSIPYAERKFDKQKAQDYFLQYRKDNMERIEFTAPKGYKAEIKAAADEVGMSTAEYIRQAIDEKMNRKV